jgi:hypothetical protein
MSSIFVLYKIQCQRDFFTDQLSGLFAVDKLLVRRRVLSLSFLHKIINLKIHSPVLSYSNYLDLFNDSISFF